ncbi:MAG: (E)-4-hydroxy-3-methylbut-2-enyl-diphosphate synthase [Rikenellaceae bacterium]
MSEVCFKKYRRTTTAVKVGNILIGGNNPIVVQSMVATATTDIDGCVEETLKIVEAGGEIVRFTAASVAEAVAIGKIREKLHERGCTVPLVADVHFNPKAAFAAAELIEKVRINPGNFIDPRAKLDGVEYSDMQYEQELVRLDSEFCRLLDICKAHRTALRIGVNHGSLSDRIMSKYGDTIEGMCESAMEFLRICRRENFHNVVVSIKSSNVVVMVDAYRAMASTMESENMHYPLHLGVTEAGEGEDARVKSALGIGTLLSEGIGDTIRVSLTEPSWCEIDVARKIVDYASKTCSNSLNINEKKIVLDRVNRKSTPKVISNLTPYSDEVAADLSELQGAEFATYEQYLEIVNSLEDEKKVPIFTYNDDDFSDRLSTILLKSEKSGICSQIALKKRYKESDKLLYIIKLAVDFGSLLLSGRGDYIVVDSNDEKEGSEWQLSSIFSLLQASRARISRTEFISCPSCGRTQFDIAQTVKMVKERCSSFKGVKIAVMGCNVNGPGEMADADFGYIGAGKGKVNLYKGRELIEKGVVASEAVEKLVELIKHG